jgi:Trk-type K+ transport system membrane component
VGHESPVLTSGSLVDQLMVPFQHSYLLIYVLIFPMLAGNEALPLFLRLEVWLLSKVVKRGSELEVSIHFLLTHGRRHVHDLRHVSY